MKHEVDSIRRSSFLPSVVGGSQTEPTIDDSNVLNDSSCMAAYERNVDDNILSQQIAETSMHGSVSHNNSLDGHFP